MPATKCASTICRKPITDEGDATFLMREGRPRKFHLGCAVDEILLDLKVMHDELEDIKAKIKKLDERR